MVAQTHFLGRWAGRLLFLVVLCPGVPASPRPSVKAEVIPPKVQPGREVRLRFIASEAVAGATLYYRVRGLASFQKVPSVEAKGTECEIRVPGTAVSQPGLEWYWVARTERGETLRYPEGDALAFLEVAPPKPPALVSFGPTGEVHTRRPKISVELDGPWNALHEQPLTFLFDEIDVSGLVQASGATLTYVPLIPLEAGEHAVRVLTTDGLGQSIELQRWRFTITERDIFRFGGTASGSYQASGGSGAAATNSFNESINLEQQFRFSSVETSFKAGLRTFAGSGGGTQRHLDLSNFLLSLKGGGQVIEAGDVSVRQSQLSAPGVARRGLRYEGKLSGYEIGAYGVRSTDVRGFRNGFGIVNPNQVLFGGSFGRSLWSDRLKLKAHAVAGKSEQLSSFSAGSARGPQKGETYAVEFSTEPWKNRLKLQGEVAHSSFHRNLGIEPGQGDQALRLRGESQLAGFTLTSGYQFFGTEFSSIANPGSSRNRWSADFGAARRLAFTNLTFNFSQQQDNVAHDPKMPTLRNQQGGVNLSISKRPLPTFTLGFTRAIQDGLRLPVNFPGIRNRNDNYTAGINYGRSKWSLNANTTHSFFNSYAGFAFSSRNRTYGLTGSYRFSQRITVSPGMNWTRATSRGTTSKVTLFTVSHNIMAVPNLLNLSGSLSWMVNSSESAAMPAMPRPRMRMLNGSSQVSLNLARWIKWYGKPTLSFQFGFNSMNNSLQPSAGKSNYTFAVSLNFSSPFQFF